MSDTKKIIINMLSTALILLGTSMIPASLIANFYKENIIAKTMLCMIIVLFLIGIMGRYISKNNIKFVKVRTSYISTILIWVIVILLSSIPFYLSGMGYKYIDAFFESCASWTTTGASAINTSELPKSLQLWRSSCNWMGGFGIIMLILVFLRNWQFNCHSLAMAEIPGPDFINSDTTFRKGYRKVLFTYIFMTIIHFILLVVAGMDSFTSLLTALSNISTSGLQHIESGFLIHLSTSFKVIITIFSFLGSINSTILILAFNFNFKRIFRDTEFKFYVFRIIIISFAIFGIIYFYDKKNIQIFKTLGDIFMQVISFTSTSGYIISPAYRWPGICKILILLQLFIGACAMSTGGGIKVGRVILASKTISDSLYSHIHPRSIRPILFNGNEVKYRVILRANLYIALFMITYLLGATLLSACNIDVLSSLNLSQAMITNTGISIADLKNPGLVSNFSQYSKFIMSLIMLAGRLEIYPLLALLTGSFWKQDSNI